MSIANEPLGEQYARVLAHHLGYRHLSGHIYEPPGPDAHKKVDYYRRAIYGFPINVKVYLRKQMFDLYFMREPLNGEMDVHCRMAGDPWPDDDLESICLGVRDLPFGMKVGEVLIEKADWLDLNPMYRGLPKIAHRHIDPAEDRLLNQPKHHRD